VPPEEARTGDAMASPRWILHLDLDQFIAAVEVRRRPELRGQPVVVGGNGDPTQRRQVVATASYEARAFGVHSGMPMSVALRKCPNAVFLALDRAAYDEASAQVWATVRQFPVLVEVWGWDEGFLGTDAVDAEGLAQSIRAQVAERTQLTCCIGIGDNKLRAKLATGFAKAPNGGSTRDAPGIFCLTRANWLDVMADRPTEALWGIGAKTAAKLSTAGVGTVRELACADPDVLAQRFGPTIGPWLRRLGQGAGDRSITTSAWVARGRSREQTFTDDLTDRGDIEAAVRKIAGAVTGEVVADGRVITHVALKVRFAPFTTRTRVKKLPCPTTDVETVQRAAVLLLDRFDSGRPVRLLGVRVDLAPVEAQQMSGDDANDSLSSPHARWDGDELMD
jgi:DNA polymerase IV